MLEHACLTWASYGINGVLHLTKQELTRVNIKVLFMIALNISPRLVTYHILVTLQNPTEHLLRTMALGRQLNSSRFYLHWSTFSKGVRALAMPGPSDEWLIWECCLPAGRLKLFRWLECQWSCVRVTLAARQCYQHSVKYYLYNVFI